ncbi:MAG: NAD(P)H-dependent oxidoreductase [Planctomycetes bacterium]|nr:NAD(P)H-dependent oxidoreductase [Planctomycetota bacterium]
MTHIIAFGASTSTQSINKRFAHWAAQQALAQLPDATSETLDLNDYNALMYSEDIENTSGIPTVVTDFQEKIKDADGIVMSLTEHNGSFTAAFKNLIDWCSRIDRNIWHDTCTLLLSTSPGQRGGKIVLQAAHDLFPYFGADIQGSMALPLFNDRFNDTDGIYDSEQRAIFESALEIYLTALR